MCSSQSDLGVAVRRTAKLSYYISSALLAAPQSPDLAPDCTEQHWHRFIPPASICCDSNQSFASYFSHPSVYECTFHLQISPLLTNLSVISVCNRHLCGLRHSPCKCMQISGTNKRHIRLMDELDQLHDGFNGLKNPNYVST